MRYNNNVKPVEERSIRAARTVSGSAEVDKPRG